MRIGFIGVGNIGRPVAEHLLEAGHAVVVHDVRKEATAPLLAAGAGRGDSPRAVAAGAEVVVTCLPGPAEMELVALGPDGILETIAPGAVYIDLTTNSPAVVRQVARRFEAKGVGMMDAPVSGGMEGARTRDLLIMVGGEPATFERVRPLLETIAKRVLHTGEIGCGTICKLMHNCASFTLDLVMAECWTTGVKAGVAPDAIVEAFKSAALGQMMSLKVRLPATYLRGDFAPRFALKLARKDLGLALDLARTCDVPMRLGALCAQEMADAMARGWGDRDSSIFLTLQEERAGVTVRVRGSAG